MKKVSIEDYKNIGQWLNSLSKKYNFQVSVNSPTGRPAKSNKNQREYRMQLIEKQQDTSKQFEDFLKSKLKQFPNLKSVKFNEISPNSSKFSSFSFFINDIDVDVVIGRGANRGENFESHSVKKLAEHYLGINKDSEYHALILEMERANPNFKHVVIKGVKQRTGSTKKEGVPIEKLGEIIGDIVLIDETDKKWYISLKNENGDTFSSYSGAASLFDSNGTLVDTSDGAKFLDAFGVDLNEVQKRFDERNHKNVIRKHIIVKKSDQNKLKSIFERAWGLNYFYVRKQTKGWNVFWMDHLMLNKLTNNIRVTDIRYPNKTSKQITIFCETPYKKYIIEIRNSKGGEYPNDIKFKVR